MRFGEYSSNREQEFWRMKLAKKFEKIVVRSVTKIESPRLNSLNLAASLYPTVPIKII